MLTLFEMAGALAAQTSIQDIGAVVAKRLRRLVPFALLVLYVHDSDTDDLEARFAAGESAQFVKGMRVSIGQRLTGWVGANRQTIVNSDPVLDLGEVARRVHPRLRNCLSSPLLSGDTLVGVLTLYSAGSDTFNEDHRRIIEVVTHQVADAFKRVTQCHPRASRELLTGLPSLDQPWQLATNGETGDSTLTLLLMDVLGLREVNAVYGRAAGDEVLRHVAQAIGTEVHVPDVVFRYGGSKFLALLGSGGSHAAEHLAQRIRNNVSSCELTGCPGVTVSVQLAVKTVSTPRDGRSLSDLLVAARIAARLSTPETSSIH